VLYISLVGFLVGLEGAPFLNRVEGSTHMHEKCLARSAVPDGEAEFRIYPDGSLEALVTLEKGNRFMDGILFWHVGYRGTFL
jgi:hypothetical protein